LFPIGITVALVIGFFLGVIATLVTRALLIGKERDSSKQHEREYEPTITFPLSNKANKRLLAGIPIDVTYH
jgi:hypothetical protein